jgi:hypothetical protein
MLLIAACASAQDHLQNRVSSEMRSEVEPSGGYVSASTPVVSLPDTPKAHRVIDKKFIFVMGALGGAESMRFTTRKLVIEREYAAGAPWITSVPTNRGWVAKYSALYATELLVAYEIKKPHSWFPGDKVVRRLWWAYPSAMSAIHIKNAVGNMRTQGPGGCTSAECAMQLQ